MNHFDHIEYFLPGRGIIVRIKRLILRQITLSPKSTEILSYYKSHLSVNGELARQLQSERWVIHPLSNFRLVEAQSKIAIQKPFHYPIHLERELIQSISVRSSTATGPSIDSIGFEFVLPNLKFSRFKWQRIMIMVNFLFFFITPLSLILPSSFIYIRIFLYVLYVIGYVDIILEFITGNLALSSSQIIMSRPEIAR